MGGLKKRVGRWWALKDVSRRRVGRLIKRVGRRWALRDDKWRRTGFRWLQHQRGRRTGRHQRLAGAARGASVCRLLLCWRRRGWRPHRRRRRNRQTGLISRSIKFEGDVYLDGLLPRLPIRGRQSNSVRRFPADNRSLQGSYSIILAAKLGWLIYLIRSTYRRRRGQRGSEGVALCCTGRQRRTFCL